MFRVSGILSIALATFCGALLFWTSQSVQRAEKKLSEVSHFKSSEEESLRVLTTEWDYLNRPERLEKLTTSNLDLDAKASGGAVFVNSPDQIPEPVVPVLPKIKPDNMMQYVSTTPVEKKEPAPVPVIQKTERENFNRLLDSVLGDGEE